MHPYAIINFHELTPAALCDVIVNKFHQPIERTAEEVMAWFNLERQDDPTAPATADLQQLLFAKMLTEIAQLMRKETTLIFPVIRNAAIHKKGRKSLKPTAYDGIRPSFDKIMLLLQKLRQVTGNYLLQGHWSPAYKICLSDMYTVEQLLQQWHYIAQNILYPAVLPANTIIIRQDEIFNTVSID
ncbi:hypothetical protein SAMN04488128_1021140 [Chitinophaga eiseniae]|uniref:Uncharacterized protein n=1 Tax=Chitinophaga eiseniae TaxID=634771 RepID=A0A1T4RH28_9BACT|nr:hypothetical protein [Chitinophaga eiseniae]SKA15314.1 hypothetical protein SAMN04488128_1021140 [Chitinophaga eiseniae]